MASSLRKSLEAQRQQREKKAPAAQAAAVPPPVRRAPEASGASSPEPARKGPPVECEPRVILTYSCGHKIGARFLQGSKCPHCQAQARKGRQPRQRVRPEARLPHGASFLAVYDAAAEQWSGLLTVDERTFEAQASGIFRLMTELDRRYREDTRPAAVAAES
jgi:hypothetical protein